ncbi:hypothetical protein B5F08_11405 [Anaeromassilibacillus sp. An172]|uniref:glycosyltransferase family 2 protein n=1 Tax=Anaeromassilibacillus sp. An172 TaxID=1965570 RepID=UPI000B37AD89|nr:glycosyltransferase [Anaeromassilibacillus sp. An172]OUP75314.1 hypothetical protein B5F08_11405 [Anaeromassilibacillus sp. An172]
MKTLPVSVLIPTMNRPQSLKKTIAGYMGGKYIPKQIIVVDQSNDNRIIKENIAIMNGYKDVADMIYVYQEQASSTKARNTAFHKASEEIIIYSDDDVDIYSDTINNVYKLMRDDSLAMIAGIDDNMSESTSRIGYFIGTKSIKNRNIGHITLSVLGRFPNGKIDHPIETVWAMGFFFVVKKSIINKYKLTWDENFSGYAYAEDLDFTYMYYKCSLNENKRCILTPQIHVKHLVSQEYRIPNRKSTFMYVINRWYLSYKHHMGVLSRCSMLWCDFCKLIIRIISCERPLDLLQAILYAIKNRKKLQNGFIDYPI